MPKTTAKNKYTFAVIVALLSGILSLNTHGAFAGSEPGSLGEVAATDADSIGDEKYRVVNVVTSIYTDRAGKRWFKAKTVLKPKSAGYFYFETEADRKKFVTAVNNKDMTWKEIQKAARDNGGKMADS